MPNHPKFYIVEASALPEIFLKVAEAKRLLDTGECSTVNDAAQTAGISRSAFYKYKDAVFPFFDTESGRIVTFNAVLRDQAGILSSLLAIFADFNANILTINQSIPVSGCAAVTVSAQVFEDEVVGEILGAAKECSGVISIGLLAGQTENI